MSKPEQDPNFQDPTYLGDGLYAGHDGHMFWLHANSHDKPTDRVALEPVVFHAFVRYVTRIMRERHPTDEEETEPPSGLRVAYDIYLANTDDLYPKTFETWLNT